MYLIESFIKHLLNNYLGGAIHLMINEVKTILEKDSWFRGKTWIHRLIN